MKKQSQPLHVLKPSKKGHDLLSIALAAHVEEGVRSVLLHRAPQNMGPQILLIGQ
jgi:hypothetical protein